jgi:hypothetical protein
MTRLDDVARSYRVAFLRYLSRREESALASGYELGRTAVIEGLGLLELARVHHDVLLEALQEAPAEDVASVAAAASDFFLEVIATYDMAQRGLREE